MSREMQKRLRHMAQITSVALDAALYQLRQAVAARKEVEEGLRKLDDDRRQMAQDVAGPATKAGADVLWQRWADARRAELNNELARRMVAEDHALRMATRAFGRDQALVNVIVRSGKPKPTPGQVS